MSAVLEERAGRLDLRRKRRLFFRVVKYAIPGKQNRWIVWFQKSWGRDQAQRPYPRRFPSMDAAVAALRLRFRPVRSGLHWHRRRA